MPRAFGAAEAVRSSTRRPQHDAPHQVNEVSQQPYRRDQRKPRSRSPSRALATVANIIIVMTHSCRTHEFDVCDSTCFVLVLDVTKKQSRRMFDQLFQL